MTLLVKIRRKRGRITNEESFLLWSKPLCTPANPCECCLAKMREALAVANKVKPRTPSIDWYGEADTTKGKVRR